MASGFTLSSPRDRDAQRTGVQLAVLLERPAEALHDPGGPERCVGVVLFGCAQLEADAVVAGVDVDVGDGLADRVRTEPVLGAHELERAGPGPGERLHQPDAVGDVDELQLRAGAAGSSSSGGGVFGHVVDAEHRGAGSRERSARTTRRTSPGPRCCCRRTRCVRAPGAWRRPPPARLSCW